MSNISVMDANWNLTSILSNNLVTSTNDWAISFNSELGGIVGISFIALVGIVIFFGLKTSNTVQTDTEALSYAGFISTIISVFFLVLGLVEWLYVLPVFVITAIAIYLNFTRQNF
jgi:cell division protein FtsW (lipid II flippase)